MLTSLRIAGIVYSSIEILMVLAAASNIEVPRLNFITQSVFIPQGCGIDMRKSCSGMLLAELVQHTRRYTKSRSSPQSQIRFADAFNHATPLFATISQLKLPSSIMRPRSVDLAQSEFLLAALAWLDLRLWLASSHWDLSDLSRQT